MSCIFRIFFLAHLQAEFLLFGSRFGAFVGPQLLSMAGYAPGAAPSKFVKLSGEEIPCTLPSAPSCRVREVIPQLRKALPLGGALRIITETGNLLENNDVIPAGVLQVQMMTLPPGRWLKLYSGALAGFDEDVLRRDLAKAWPRDFVRRGPEPDHEDIEFEEWQDSCFNALQVAVIHSTGAWANYWTFAHSACSYGYQYVRHPYPTMAPSIDLIVNDVKRWQKLLLELEDEFAILRSRCAGFQLCEHLEYAIASLLRYCPSFHADVTWHVGFEMWYRPFAELVGWYLSSAGFEERTDLMLCVDNAIRGFRSYRCPVDTAVQVAKHVASAMNQRHQKVGMSKLKSHFQSPRRSSSQ